MRGHPIFIAQHATATCCRGCLEKWHRIPRGHELTAAQIEYVVAVLSRWLNGNASFNPEPSATVRLFKAFFPISLQTPSPLAPG